MIDFPAPPDKRYSKRLVGGLLVMAVLLAVATAASGYAAISANPRDDPRYYRAYARGHVVENMTTESVRDYAFKRIFEDRCLVWVGEASSNKHTQLIRVTDGWVEAARAQGQYSATGEVRQIPAMSSLHGVPGIGEWVSVVVTCR